jgi:hypothetical protein
LGWRCNRRGCLGRLALNSEISQVLSEIAHYQNKGDVISKNIKLELTNGAKNTNEKFEDVLMSSLHDINEEDRQYKGVFNTARDYFTKVRKEVHGYTSIGYNDIITKYTKKWMVENFFILTQAMAYQIES